MLNSGGKRRRCRASPTHFQGSPTRPRMTGHTGGRLENRSRRIASAIWRRHLNRSVIRCDASVRPQRSALRIGASRARNAGSTFARLKRSFSHFVPSTPFLGGKVNGLKKKKSYFLTFKLIQLYSPFCFRSTENGKKQISFLN